MSLSAGDTVCASTWVRNQGSETGASGTFVLWLLGTANENSAKAFSGLGNGTNWRQLETCATATGTRSAVRVQFYPTPGGPTVDIDDIDVH